MEYTRAMSLLNEALRAQEQKRGQMFKVNVVLNCLLNLP